MPAPVSVVIPTKDRADLLALTLGSVAAQSRPPAEVVVADDGSTDHTPEVVRAAGAVLLENPAGGWGPSAARNAGFERASSPLVHFVDSDDLLLPEALERLAAALERDPDAPFAYGRGLAARRDDRGWEPDSLIRPHDAELREPLCSLFARCYVPSGGAMVRTEAMRSVGGFDPQVRWGEDHHLWVRLALRGTPASIQEVACIHRRHAGNTQEAATHLLVGRPAMLGLADAEPRLRPCLPRKLGVELCEVAVGLAKARRPGPALAESARTLSSRGGRGTILAEAARHFRRRRAARREALELWESSPELRDWLAAY